MKPTIYLDHAATSPLRPEALEKMLPYFSRSAGNASSLHAAGREARKAVEEARRRIADVLGAEPREIFFTSGGSESDNWAVRCGAEASGKRHIVTSAIEHHAVLYSCREMERLGYEVTYLTPDPQGTISPEAVKAAIRPDTGLISIMAANNEIGTLEPAAEIGRVAREAGIVFHTDAVQAVGAVPVDVNAWGVDMLSLSGHKFGGPKGVGALYLRRGTRLHSLICGGAQERGLRAGTENVPGVAGMGEALRLAAEELPRESLRLAALRDELYRLLLQAVPGCRLNGSPSRRLPGNLHLSIPGVDAQSLLARLDLEGLQCSGGSACTSGSMEPSHVLAALGLSEEETRGSVRLTLGRENTEEEIRRAAEILSSVVASLREARQ